jgi:DNA polymerase-1
MKRYVFDIETNGLLPELDTIHCLVIKDVDTGEVISCHNHGGESVPTIDIGLLLLASADEIIGHNIIGFDLLAIQKVCPWWKTRAKITDTLVMSRLIYPDLRDRDFTYWRKHPDFPTKMIGSHSLRAWGHRLCNFKEDYDGGWEDWSPEMQKYCEQDIVVTAALWDRLVSKNIPRDALDMEQQIAHICTRQELYGFKFDVEAAGKLYAKLLKRRSELHTELQSIFPPKTIRTPFVPKSNNKTRGYVKGVEIIKEKIVEFNPSSRDHIAERLEELGWKPKAFTQEGKPQVDESVLSEIEKKYPVAKLLNENLLIDKRIGQLAEGKEAWLKKYDERHRIHGRVNTVGAVTRRMTHSHPNITQVPSVRAPYGEECRSLFIADKGKLLVGCDADALELRCLAGYMAHYDGGAYIRTVLEGKKEDGTDMHTLNAKALGCDRDTAKTWFYAFIYGAGDYKLGSILGKAAKAGVESRKKFLTALPALAKIVEGVRARVRTRGFILSLDNTPLHIRSEHAALNTLLQSAGAIFMKRAQVILDDELRTIHKLTPGSDYEFVATIHDEFQTEVEEKHAELVGRTAAASIRKAGEYYQFKCPLAGNYVIGSNWCETH